MTLRGHVRNGAVVFKEALALPEGTAVEVELRKLEHDEAGSSDSGPTWGEVFADLAGTVEGLPADMARNHDHYIHGTPKRSEP